MKFDSKHRKNDKRNGRNFNEMQTQKTDLVCALIE
jgi:hypothetical protein